MSVAQQVIDALRHGGMSARRLTAAMEMTGASVNNALYRLQAAGFVEVCGTGWNHARADRTDLRAHREGAARVSRQLVDLEPLSERELRDIAAAAFYAGVTAEHFEGVLFTASCRLGFPWTLAMVVSEADTSSGCASFWPPEWASDDPPPRLHDGQGPPDGHGYGPRRAAPAALRGGRPPRGRHAAPAHADDTGAVLTIRLPHRLETPNAWLWSHWRTKKRAKDAWSERLRIACLSPAAVAMSIGGNVELASWIGWTAPTNRPIVRVTRQVPSRRNFITDRENRLFAAKALVDCPCRPASSPTTASKTSTCRWRRWCRRTGLIGPRSSLTRAP